MSTPSATQVTAAWITAGVAILGLVFTTTVQTVYRYRDARRARELEVITHRREALHTALQVVDHVYANSSFGNNPPAKPHNWNMALAWDAMNKMILYCGQPAKTTSAFAAAIGLHNPDAAPPPRYGPKGLAAFRREVARELDLPETSYVDPDVVWIAQLPGAQ